ncbi:holin family protein [Pseudooceanicola sp. C21-150M6]|uniref:holin family protein n=1 Tax=Pseudooceanicola sp. C21-150M6 TaxID=3434355 RepID=UPI003D7F35B7
MGLITSALTLLFGGGRNAIRDTAHIFRENAEAAAIRDLSRTASALTQYSAEFRDDRSAFDRIMDGVNRLPRPLLALGTLGLFASAMIDPLWFADRMTGLALVPEALWWLMGAIVSFYFGARHQVKGQQFQRDLARTLSLTPPDLLPDPPRLTAEEPNAALRDWDPAHDR